MILPACCFVIFLIKPNVKIICICGRKSVKRFRIWITCSRNIRLYAINDEISTESGRFFFTKVIVAPEIYGTQPTELPDRNKVDYINMLVWEHERYVVSIGRRCSIFWYIQFLLVAEKTYVFLQKIYFKCGNHHLRVFLRWFDVFFARPLTQFDDTNGA